MGMVIANLSNLGWISGPPRRNQAVFSQLLLDAEGAFEEGFFIQPPLMKTARTFQLSRSSEFEVVVQPNTFRHPVTVLQPCLTLPAGYPAQAARRAIRELGQKLVKEYFRNRQYLLWINSITHFQAQLAEHLMPGAEFSVFDSSDLLIMYERRGGEHSTQANAILNASDVAVCANEEAMAQITHPVKHLLPDWADCAMADGNEAPCEMPPLFPKAPGSVYIGFRGVLSSERTDFDLLHAIFVRFPGYQFIFAGSANRSSLLSRLKTYPNFHHVPAVPEESTAYVIKQFDLAIVPELDNSYTRGTDGTRIFDYLACGVPVLSTTAQDTEKFGDAVQVAGSIWEFSYQLERLVRAPRQNTIPRPVQETWNFGARVLKELLRRSSTSLKTAAK
jgi:hypothetical protein